MKTDEQRGRVGAWAYHARADHGWSVEEVVDRLTERGHRVTAGTIRGAEAGTKLPGRELIRALAGIYETRPPEEPIAQPLEGLDKIAAILQEQNRHIEEQARQTGILNRLLAGLLVRDEHGVDPAIRTDLLRFAADVVPELSATPGLPQPAPGQQTAAPR
jgi:transcriptional regulator with XRE-family HTH domain